MKAAAAIRTFFNNGKGLRDDLIYAPVTVSEIRDFKESCTPEEWQSMAKCACELMGETFESA